MIQPIYTYGESVLLLPTQDLNDKLTLGYESLFETMYNAKGSGLAGPQVGSSWKIFVVDAEISEGTIFKGVFINPKILSYSGPPYTMIEGCLSLPGINVPVVRPGTIEMEYYDENWKHYKETFNGLPARILQHEYDHLIGKLFIDHLDILTKEKILLNLVNIKQKKVKTLYPII
jgi:peptide deformylase